MPRLTLADTVVMLAMFGAILAIGGARIDSTPLVLGAASLMAISLGLIQIRLRSKRVAPIVPAPPFIPEMKPEVYAALFAQAANAVGLSVDGLKTFFEDHNATELQQRIAVVNIVRQTLTIDHQDAAWLQQESQMLDSKICTCFDYKDEDEKGFQICQIHDMSWLTGKEAQA